jgi:hypothetical protein
MSSTLPKIDLGQGDVVTNSRVALKWYGVIAWALSRNPDGLFLSELKAQYNEVCDQTGVVDRFDDAGDPLKTLTRSLTLTLAICKYAGWVTYQLRMPTRAYPVRLTNGAISVPLISEPLWTLTKKGRRAMALSRSKQIRSLCLHQIRFGLAPSVGKLRAPIAVASGVIGLVKIVAGWGDLQKMVEGAVAVAGAFILSLWAPSDSHTH